MLIKLDNFSVIITRKGIRTEIKGTKTFLCVWANATIGGRIVKMTTLAKKTGLQGGTGQKVLNRI